MNPPPPHVLGLKRNLRQTLPPDVAHVAVADAGAQIPLLSRPQLAERRAHPPTGRPLALGPQADSHPRNVAVLRGLCAKARALLVADGGRLLHRQYHQHDGRESGN
jgi:hypothetical protein